MVLTKQQISDVEEIIKDSLKSEELITLISSLISKKIKDALEEKFEKYDAKIAQLEMEINNLKHKDNVHDGRLEEKVDKIQQHHKRNNLRFIGLKETKNEDVAKNVLELINNNIKIQVDKSQIISIYRTGKTKNNRPRHIIVKFQDNNLKYNIYKNKKLLRGTGVIIKEDLTTSRLKIVSNASDKYGFKNVWTTNGNVYAKTENGVRKLTKTELNQSI